ncbi:MAG: hypothetical protein WCH84_10620 [Verrucomicrobiota bacterium]
MPISSRENLLRSLRCDNPHWIPVCPHLFPNENPTQGVPASLEEVLRSSSGNLALDHLKLGEYLGADDYLLPVEAPAVLVSATCTTKEERSGTNQLISTLSTPKGDLRQVTTFSDDAPSLVTERYVKTAADAVKLIEYFSSLRVELAPDVQKVIPDTRTRLGDKGILFCRLPGTPLGMCYREYSDLTHLIYLLSDEPGIAETLFACIEEKFFQLYERILREAPEIDVLVGMDDTSTTLISPAMFEKFNVEVTNLRADLCHRYGKIYMHHSCGLIRNLLPIYRQTRMNGVDAFTVPPIGDVGYAEGRRLLGPDYSICSPLTSGLPALDKDTICRQVADRFQDAHKANNVIFIVGGADLTFPAMEMLFSQAQELKQC